MDVSVQTGAATAEQLPFPFGDELPSVLQLQLEFGLFDSALLATNAQLVVAAIDACQHLALRETTAGNQLWGHELQLEPFWQ